MMHSILLTLLATATLPAPALPPAAPLARERHAAPVIKVWTDWEEYSRGQQAQVHIKTREDGYVVVLQADVDGRVRVLYPLDPGDDNFVRGGHDVDLAGRGGKQTFFVDGPPGMAAVYAAYSAVPFRFTDYVRGDHWDYDALYDKSFQSDFENAFTALVDKMSTGKFDYDIYRYRVEGNGSETTAYSGGGPTSTGSPCWVAPYDPYCGGPTYIPGPFYGAAYPWGYGYGPSFGLGYYGGYGWSFGLSFGFGYPYYGYGGYPYYGYGYGGYPGYGYGYPGYGYPGYGYPGYGYPTRPPYVGKPGAPVTGIGYRPRGSVPVTYGGLGTPYRGTTGGLGTPYRGGNGKNLPTLGSPVGIEHRTPGPISRPNGWTLGRPGNVRPRGDDGRGGTARGGEGRGYSGGNSAGHGGGAPSARPPRGDSPPRYEPNSGGRGSPSGGSTGGRYEPPRGGSPAARPPSSPAPRSGGSPPAGHPSSGGGSHPSSGGGGGGHRVP